MLVDSALLNRCRGTLRVFSKGGGDVVNHHPSMTLDSLRRPSARAPSPLMQLFLPPLCLSFPFRADPFVSNQSTYTHTQLSSLPTEQPSNQDHGPISVSSPSLSSFPFPAMCTGSFSFLFSFSSNKLAFPHCFSLRAVAHPDSASRCHRCALSLQ